MKASIEAPSKLLLLSEGRALFEFGLGVAALPALMSAKRGDGHPVLVLPGFLASDRSTEPLRRYLAAIGYDAYGWELGSNRTGVHAMRLQLRERLEALRAKAGRKVSLIGWSLGGIYARDLALTSTDDVRYVITLGSPIAPSETNASGLYRRMSGSRAPSLGPEERAKISRPLPVPTSAFFSKSDGVVNWRASIVEPGAAAENIEVYGSHTGLGVNPSVLWAIADRLQQPEGTFAPFSRRGPFALTYPRAEPQRPA